MVSALTSKYLGRPCPFTSVAHRTGEERHIHVTQSRLRSIRGIDFKIIKVIKAPQTALRGKRNILNDWVRLRLPPHYPSNCFQS